MKEKKQTPYYVSEDLKKFGKVSESVPDLGDKFFDWYGSVFKEGALTAREKSLIALAVSMTLQCPYCIEAYTKDCIKRGVSEEQMTESMHVASAMRAGASMVHGVQMKNFIDKLVMG